jgi:hypothetical protein
MDKFRNVNYNYQTPDDSFIARGLQLNMIVDEINDITAGISPDPIASVGVTDIVLGPEKDIDAAFIDYKATFPTYSLVNVDQTGKLEVNNSMYHGDAPKLSWTRESTVQTSGTENVVGIEFLIVVNDLVMRVTNTTGVDMNFNYSLKILNYDS